jgi:hypothetical protein
LRLDKQSTPDISTNLETTNESKFMFVPLPRQKTTLNEFVGNGIKLMGERVWTYNPNNRGNCQHFVNGMLEANHLNTDKTRKFVLQNADELLESIPTIPRRLMDEALKIISRGDNKLHGSGGII